MVDQRLIDYISQQLSYGYSYQQIKQALLRQGWPEAEIDEAINSISGSEKPIHRLKQVEKKPSHFNIILPSVIIIAVLGVGIFLIMPYLTLPICGECQYLEDHICKDYACCSDSDCDDGNPDTIDSCINPKTLSSACSNVLKEGAKKGPLLWRVDGEGTSYLFGTIHVPDDRVLSLSDTVMQAFEVSDSFYAELSLDAAAQFEALEMSMLPPNQTLEDILPAELYERTDDYLRSRNLSIQPFSQFKIWLLISNLGILDYLEELQQGKQALDLYLYTLATERGKETGGIETVEEQISVFDSLTVEEQVSWLEQTLNDLEEYDRLGKGVMDDTVEAYLSGDEELLLEFLLEAMEEDDPLIQKLMPVLYTNRNYIMAERIAKKIQANPQKTYFFAIGAGHYPGQEGILNLLREDEFSITRVTNPSDIKEPPYTGSLDCGTDFDCFVDASYGCEQAKVLYTVTVNLFGMLSTFTYYMEFKGIESSKCIYYERIEDNTVEFSNELVQQMLDGGATQEEIDQQEQIANENAQLTIGMEKTCKFTPTDLTAMLNRWKQGSYSSEDFDVAECVSQQPSTNTSCTIQAALSSMKLLKGVSSSCSVSGYQGSESDVSWLSEDTNIATVDPATGASIVVISQNTGTTQIIATDNAVGPDCTISVEVTVESLY